MSKFKFADQLGFSPPIVFEEDVVSEEGLYNDKIDFDKLVKTIKKYRAFEFDYRDYISKKAITPSTNTLDGTEPQSYEIHIPLIVNDPEKGGRALQLSGVLNKKKGIISRSQGQLGFSFKLDANTKNILYVKKIAYSDSNEVAIRIETPLYDDYIALSTFVKSTKNKEIDALIIREFNEAFRNVKDNATLKWLYEKAPLFVLEQREDQLLLNDLNVLLLYDLDSWFIDSSTAMMKLLRGFTDSKIAYDFFNENPNETIRVYKAMSDESREQFTMLLTTLSYIYSEKERRSPVSFSIGKNYTLNSHIFLKKNQDEILLQQYVYEYKSVEVESAFESGSTFVKTRKSVLVTQTVNQFHPLDMVTLKDEITGETELVCALHVKLLSDRAEWQNVITTVTIVVTVVAIIASVGVLAAGATGVAATIAVLEIVVGIGDLIHILKRANLDGTEEGNWFEKNWEKIRATTAVISIGSALHQGLVKNGPKVLGRLRGVRNPASRSIQQRIEGLLTTIQIEAYFFFKQGLSFVTFEPFSLVAKKFGKDFATKMKKFGVSLTTPVEDSKDVRALYYNGGKIEEGTEKELKAILKEIFPFGDTRGLQTIRYLEEIAEESIGLLNRTTRVFGKVSYTILEYKNIVRWKVRGSKIVWDNHAKIVDGVLDFDFNTFGIKGLGKQWTDDAFEIFGERIKEVKVEWTRNPAYPDGESLGMKQFWENLKKNDWNEYKAVEDSRFYETMNRKGFGKIKEPFSPFAFDEKITLILIPNK
ncbi:MAG: hypothetical protein ACI9Y7_001667 [Dokdonia sp.]|jgi:hypothetical protein